MSVPVTFLYIKKILVLNKIISIFFISQMLDKKRNKIQYNNTSLKNHMTIVLVIVFVICWVIFQQVYQLSQIIFQNINLKPELGLSIYPQIIYSLAYWFINLLTLFNYIQYNHLGLNCLVSHTWNSDWMISIYL